MPTEHRLQFTGSGREYFRIWIVNLLLTLLTLGIYSAWAKVRREQYFHRNTLLDGSGFDYHGNPKAILKGRIIAVGLLVILSLTGKWIPEYYYPVLLLGAPLIPWLLIRSLAFRARNTLFRGLHFNFLGTYKGICKACLCYILLLIALIGAMAYSFEMMRDDGLYMQEKQLDIEAEADVQAIRTDKATMDRTDPDFKEKIRQRSRQRWQASEEVIARAIIDAEIPWLIRWFAGGAGVLLLFPLLVRAFQHFRFGTLAFGASHFHIQCRLLSFYGVCLLGLWPLVLVMCCVAFLIFLSLPLLFYMSLDNLYELLIFITGIYLLVVIVTPPYFKAFVSNLAWNNTSLGRHHFVSDMTFRGITGITLSNWLLILLSLGLYWPWAKVRMTAYRAKHLAIRVDGDIDHFIAGVKEEKSAIGEEIADIFDFDAAL